MFVLNLFLDFVQLVYSVASPSCKILRLHIRYNVHVLKVSCRLSKSEYVSREPTVALCPDCTNELGISLLTVKGQV